MAKAKKPAAVGTNNPTEVRQAEPAVPTSQPMATCSTCVAFQGSSERGMCRMNPPHPVAGFPRLMASEWCMKHTPADLV